MSGRADAAIRLVRAAARSAGLGQRSDPELLAAFLAGERDAFEMLVRRHGPLVLRACRHAARCEADAEGTVQVYFRPPGETAWSSWFPGPSEPRTGRGLGSGVSGQAGAREAQGPLPGAGVGR